MECKYLVMFLSHFLGQFYIHPTEIPVTVIIIINCSLHCMHVITLQAKCNLRQLTSQWAQRFDYDVKHK